jgi:hypothetical protein
VVWAYTLTLPSLAATGLVTESFVDDGPFGIGLLAPHALFGLDGLDEVSHSMLWSMLVNVGLFVGLSLTGRREPAEHVQASTFVETFTHVGGGADARLWGGSATVGELRVLLARFLGYDGAGTALASYAASTGADLARRRRGAELVQHVESVLAGGGFRVRAVHRRLSRGGGTARCRRGVADPRRDLRGARIQPGA